MVKKESEKEIEKVEEKAEKAEKVEKVSKTNSGIEIGEPMDLRPKNLPLVVKLPAGASSAQKEYAKVLNGYAYQNPKKWAKKKDKLIKRLESLAGIEIIVGDKRLSINKSEVSFAFISDGKGNEIYAGQSPVGEE